MPAATVCAALKYTVFRPVVIKLKVAADCVVCPTVIEKFAMDKDVALTTSKESAVMLPAVKPAAFNSAAVKMYCSF